MTSYLFIEPSKAHQVQEGLRGRLHDTLLGVPGVKRLYPRQPLLVQLGREASTYLAESAAAGEDGGSAQEREDLASADLVLAARLGLEEGVDVPDVARLAASKLAEQCPGASIELEIASC